MEGRAFPINDSLNFFASQQANDVAAKLQKQNTNPTPAPLNGISPPHNTHASPSSHTTSLQTQQRVQHPPYAGNSQSSKKNISPNPQPPSQSMPGHSTTNTSLPKPPKTPPQRAPAPPPQKPKKSPKNFSWPYLWPAMTCAVLAFLIALLMGTHFLSSFGGPLSRFRGPARIFLENGWILPVRLLHGLSMLDTNTLRTHLYEGETTLQTIARKGYEDVFLFLASELGVPTGNLLQWACKTQPLGVVQWLVEIAKVDVRKAEFDFQDAYFKVPNRTNTILGLSAYHNRIDIVTWANKSGLIEMEAKDNFGRGMHFSAVFGGQLSFLKWLKKDLEYACNSLESSETEKCVGGVKKYDLSESDPEGVNIAHTATYRRELDILRWLASEESGLYAQKTKIAQNVFHFAALCTDFQCMEYVSGYALENVSIFDLDFEGSNILHYAAQRGETFILKNLTRILRATDMATHRNNRGLTPYLTCSMQNGTFCTEWFAVNAKKDFEISQIDKQGRNVAHLAAMYGNIGPIEWHKNYVGEKRMLRSVDSANRTPRDIAVLHRQWHIVEYLDKIERY